MTSLAVIVPTRGRPHAVGQLAQAWVDTAAGATLVLGLDDDDPALHDYGLAVERARVEHPDVRIEVVAGPRLRMVGTLNAIAVDYASRYGALGFMGDDHRPRTERWDQRFLGVLADRPRIVYGNDLLQGETMATAVFMTSDIVGDLGYMAPPELIHLYADVVWCDWGRAIERLTYLPDVVIEHMHPVVGKTDWDAGYTDVNNATMYSADGDTYADYHSSGRFARDVEKLRGGI